MERFDRRLEELEVLSRGYWGTVYVLSEDRLLKTSPKYSAEMVKNEYERGRIIAAAGVPCVAPIDLLETEEGLAITYERIPGGSVARRASQHLESMDTYLDAYDRLCRKMWAVKLAPGTVPSLKSDYLKLCDGLTELCGAETVEKYRAFFNALPDCDTFVHLDLHATNVMYNGGDCRLIDLTYCVQGHPAFDMASTAFAYWLLLDSPLVADFQKSFRITREEAACFWEGFCGRIFSGLPEKVAAERKRSAEYLSRMIFVKNYMQDVTLGIVSEADRNFICECMVTFLNGESDFVLRVLREWEWKG